MGIIGATAWKEILRAEFPKCWKSATPATFRGFQVVIEDLMLRLFLYSGKSAHRKDLVAWWVSHLKWVFDRFPQAETYVGMFDDGGHTPRAKEPVQRERDASRPCPTQGQLDDLGPAAKLCNPESSNEDVFLKLFGAEKRVLEGKVTPFGFFLELYQRTRAMRPDLLRFVHHNMVTMIPSGKEVVLDGGPEPGEWKQFVANCPSKTESIPIVGEGDIKMVRGLERYPKKHAWICSADTDSIIILLLAMHRELARNPQFRRKIYLDMGNMTPGKKKNVLDVVALWKAIMARAEPGGPWHGLRNPVETFCAVITSSGTDFFKNAPGVGPKTIWAAFTSRVGRKILSRSVHIDPRGQLDLAENRLLQFGRLTYSFVNHSQVQDFREVPATFEELEDLYNKARRSNYTNNLEKFRKKSISWKAGKLKKKPSNPRRPWLALSECQMRVRVRMLGWTLAYWVDAHQRTIDTSLDTRDGHPLYGWILVPGTGVKVAPAVSSV